MSLFQQTNQHQYSPNRIEQKRRVVLLVIHVPQRWLPITLPARLETLFVECIDRELVVASESNVCGSNLCTVFRAYPEGGRVLLRSQSHRHTREIFLLRVADWGERCEIPLYDFIEAVGWDGDSDVIEHSLMSMWVLGFVLGFEDAICTMLRGVCR